MGKDGHRDFHTENEEESEIKERSGMASEGRWSMCLEWGAFGSHKRQKKAGGKIKGKKQNKKRPPPPENKRTQTPGDCLSQALNVTSTEEAEWLRGTLLPGELGEQWC